MAGALLGFLESKALALDGEQLGAVHEPVDEGDHTGGVGEDVVPFTEDFVGGQNDGALEVSTGDDLEQEVGVAVVIGQVADLVD